MPFMGPFDEETQDTLAKLPPGDALQEYEQRSAPPPANPQPNPGTDPTPAAPAAQPASMPAPQPSSMPVSRGTAAPESGVGQQTQPERGFDWSRALYALGGGNVADIDRVRAARDAKPMEALKLQQAQGEMEDQKLARQQARDALDPNSSISRAAQQRHATQMRLYANSPGVHPSIAAQFNAEADNAAGKSAAQLAQSMAQYEKFLPNYTKLLDTQADNALAAENMGLRRMGVEAQQEMAQNTLGLKRSELGLKREAQAEDVRHHQAIEDATKNKQSEKAASKQEKLNEQVEDIGNMQENLQIAADAKKDVDVGPIATPINKLRQYTPWPNEKFNTLQEYLGNVRNEIKLLKSGKAVTPTEEKGLNEELANLEKLQDDKTFEQRLRGMQDRLRALKQRKVRQYQRGESGQALDKSVTAREATAPKSEAQKALDWADANPGDPRAAAIKKKLGVE